MLRSELLVFGSLGHYHFFIELPIFFDRESETGNSIEIAKIITVAF